MLYKRIDRLEKQSEGPTRRGLIEQFFANLRKAYGDPDDTTPTPSPTPAQFDRQTTQALERVYGNRGQNEKAN